MNCPNCDKILKPNAKFCGGCGSKVLPPQSTIPAGGEAQSHLTQCSDCGATVNAASKFCGSCGRKIEPSAVRPQGNVPEDAVAAFEQVRGYLIWDLHPGQVAAVMTAAKLESFEAARGVVIQEGTRAIIYVDGAPVAELDHGRWDFPEAERDDKPGALRIGMANALTGAFRFVENLLLGKKNSDRKVSSVAQNSWAEKIRNSSRGGGSVVSIVLIRDGQLPLVLDFEELRTATVSAHFAIKLLVRIANAGEFYRTLLSGRQVYGLADLGPAVAAIALAHVAETMAGYSADQIVQSPALNSQVQEAIGKALQPDWAFLECVRVVSVSTQNADLERLRDLRQELYLSEQELLQLTKRNDFEKGAALLHLRLKPDLSSG